ncbi:helix-turn-helix transcriptional regulator [Aureimonas sp. AU20]|uniref:helix-turn-helix domain-containing protein n=1 Tax=Aureimonas sp. AU20 TaxID=1349819 RepID=UPI00071F60B5|nr:helix-turn-helix transcriptional regulator [Aureimonas sp. AU20]ALN73556.1 hypothetical protein M673_12582 [Aureimonas sp. AU20]
MKSLKDWREEAGLSARRVAEALGLDDASGAGTIWRWETGRSRPDADVVAKIVEISDGKVTASDMHLTRLAFLRSRSVQAAMRPGVAA